MLHNYLSHYKSQIPLALVLIRGIYATYLQLLFGALEVWHKVVSDISAV